MLSTIKNIASCIRSKVGDFNADTAIVLGSGLGSLASEIDAKFIIPYSEIPNFPISTVSGHNGRFVFGTLSGVDIIVMQGRVHYYEGYSPQDVVLGVRVLAMLGVTKLILSNAAGALNPSFKVGDIMVITDHINFIPNPLIGPNIEELGVRFPSMASPYSKRFTERMIEIGFKHEIALQRGCYVAVTGPSYETKAEIKFYQLIGGDTVGMSTAPEVIAAVHAGMEVLALSLVTNLSVSDNTMAPPSHSEVIEEGVKAQKKMSLLITNFLQST